MPLLLRWVGSAAIALQSPSIALGEWFEGISVARYDLELGFEIDGVVAEVPVEAGDRVAEGDVLVRLDGRDAEARTALLRLRAESTFEVDSALEEWELAKIEHEQMLEAQRRGAVMETEVRRSALEAERERLAYELFKQRQDEARLQLQQAEIDLERYVLRAPRDGIVEDVAVSKGETVREVTPVLRFVDVSSLRVEVPTPGPIASSLRVGNAVLVDWDGTGPELPVEGRVVQVATVGDPASGLRLVRVEVQNSGGRAAGEVVKVAFKSEESGQSEPVAGTPEQP